MYTETFDSADIAEIGGWLAAARRVVFFTGAGISTDSGIPDFRGPQGLWRKNPLAEKTSTLSHYLGDAEVRKVAWQARLENRDRVRMPNDGHRALVEVQNRGILAAVITQNVDGLHQESGIADDKVIELHGTSKFGVCWDCKDRMPIDHHVLRVMAGDPDPHCELCGGIIKSDTILFEEGLVDEVFERAHHEASTCDLLIAVGSTLQVSPANGVVVVAKRSGAKVVIVNGEATDFDRFADKVVVGAITPALRAILAAAGS